MQRIKQPERQENIRKVSALQANVREIFKKKGKARGPECSRKMG